MSSRGRVRGPGTGILLGKRKSADDEVLVTGRSGRTCAADRWSKRVAKLVAARESGLWWVTGSFWAGQSDMFGRRTGRWAGAIAGLISDRT